MFRIPSQRRSTAARRPRLASGAPRPTYSARPRTLAKKPETPIAALAFVRHAAGDQNLKH